MLLKISVFSQRQKSTLFACDALRDLVPFLQLKKREKRQCRSDTFIKVAGFSLQLY